MTLAVEVFNSASAAGSTTAAINCNTSGLNRIVLIFICLNSDVLPAARPTVSSVTATGLTFAKYTSLNFDTASVDSRCRLEVWWAFAAAQQTANPVTVTVSPSARGIGLGVGAVSNVPPTRWTLPFDADPSLPVTSTNPSDTLADAAHTWSSHDAQVVGFTVWGSATQNTNGTSTPAGYTLQIDLNFNGTSFIAQKLRVYAEVFNAQQVSTITDLGTCKDWGLISFAVGGNFIFPQGKALSVGW